MNPILLNIVTLALQALATKEAQDAILDLIEDLIASTETLIDDRALLPLIQAYREFNHIEDNDDVPGETA